MEWNYLPHEELRDSYLLVWNEGEWERAVSRKLFGSSPPHPLKSSSVKECEVHFRLLETELAKKFLLKRLALKNMPTFQLQQEMNDLLITPQVSKSLIARFQQEGYIDDAVWLRAFIAQQKQKKLSVGRILALLQQKGAPENLVAEAEEQLSEDDTDQQLCQAALDKLLKTKFKNFDANDYREKRRLCEALARKGFSFEVIQRAFNNES